MALACSIGLKTVTDNNRELWGVTRNSRLPAPDPLFRYHQSQALSRFSQWLLYDLLGRLL